MKPPHPLILGGVAILIAAIGYGLWQGEGAMIWLQQIVAYCL